MSLYFDRTGTPIDLERWTELREDASYRLLERTSVGCFEVITAWSGIDQGHASIYFGEPPLVFGTIARHMTTGAFRDDLEAFAATEEEALENHRALVGRLAVLP